MSYIGLQKKGQPLWLTLYSLRLIDVSNEKPTRCPAEPVVQAGLDRVLVVAEPEAVKTPSPLVKRAFRVPKS